MYVLAVPHCDTHLECLGCFHLVTQMYVLAVPHSDTHFGCLGCFCLVTQRYVLAVPHSDINILCFGYALIDTLYFKCTPSNTCSMPWSCLRIAPIVCFGCGPYQHILFVLISTQLYSLHVLAVCSVTHIVCLGCVPCNTHCMSWLCDL